MRKSQLISVSLFTCLVFAGSSAFGQLNQLNGGGGTGGTAGGGGQTGDAAGGTTQAAGGITGQTPGAAVNEALAGNNAAQAFIGGGNTDGGFVGGGVETLFNQANRNFRAITQGQTTSGGTRETSGTPRQVPVSLKIAFSVPKADGRSQLIERNGPAIERLAVMKPELRNVSVTVNEQGIATLAGSTPDSAASRLAVNLVRLRPGVRGVRNQLAVEVPAAPE